jgi:hypothetical protein
MRKTTEIAMATNSESNSQTEIAMATSFSTSTPTSMAIWTGLQPHYALVSLSCAYRHAWVTGVE